jgi:hypothetical protein
MPRHAVIALLGVVAAGLVGLVAVALSDERRTAFTLGVAPGGVAAVLPPSTEVCQSPVRVAEDFNVVNFQVGTYMRPGEPLEVTVRSADGVARGRLPGGYGDGLEQRVDVGTVAADQKVSVCIKNVGNRRMAIYGGAGAAARLTSAAIDGREQDVDLTLVFEREPRSALASLSAVFRHASRYRPDWAGPWLFWALGLIVVLGIPVALAAAVGSAARSDREGSPDPVRDDRSRPVIRL